MSEVVDIRLFDTADCTILKVKYHCIELHDDIFVFKASYKSDEKIEEVPQDVWRCWEEIYYKNHVTHYGYIRSPMENQQWIWNYVISVQGTDEDIQIIFESQSDVLKFHDIFKAYMHA